MIKNKMRSLFVLFSLFSIASIWAGELGEAYVAQDYNLVAKLLPSTPESLEKRLIGALCDLYDRSRQNVGRGQKTCAGIFANENVEMKYRLEAGIALARTAQLMKERRDVYGDRADSYDHLKIYRELMRLAPGTETARNAFVYLMRESLEQNEGWEELESFCREFKGERKLLAPVHFLAEYEYIRQKRDYRNAARHLEAGSQLGFSNPNVGRSALFRLGFLNYRKLGNKALAKKYFQEYLKKYPVSNLSVVAKRFLREMESDQ
jgi:tetratricopeptide (TPR) repeat protein